MEGFKIVSINDIDYALESKETGNIYQIKMSFIDFDDEPQVGDVIAFHSTLLDENYEGYSHHYFFGTLDDQSGRTGLRATDLDAVVLKTQNGTYALKRIYG